MVSWLPVTGQIMSRRCSPQVVSAIHPRHLKAREIVPGKVCRKRFSQASCGYWIRVLPRPLVTNETL